MPGGTLLSVCIPTFDRPELVDYCLERLSTLARRMPGLEVVVADSSPGTETGDACTRHRHAFHRLLHCRQRGRCAPYEGFVSAMRSASGRYVVYLADDDTLVDESVERHVAHLERDPGLLAVFADWIAYDDEHGSEIHRYFPIRGPAEFGPGQPLEYFNFVVQNVLYPEMGVMRREALLRVDGLGRRMRYGAHRWAFRLRGLGRVAFSLDAFYREHRVVKARFARGLPDNMGRRFQTLGDEMRNELETILLWAVQEAGRDRVPEDQVAAAKGLIDRYLQSRIPLEIQRCIAERDWLMALELRRREVLWNGPGPHETRLRDAMSISLPAALQAVRELLRLLPAAEGLAIRGFDSDRVPALFRQMYPEVAVVTDPRAAGDARVRLVLWKLEHQREDPADGLSVALESLLQQHAVESRIDMTGL